MPRPTKSEINLSAIEHNLKLIRNIIGDKVRMLPVVKADAYGHGIKQISGKLLECGIDFLGVATIDEAVILKKFIAKNKFADKNISILVLGAVLPNELGAILKHDIVQTVADRQIALALSEKAKKLNKKARVHVKIDTGMGRIGVWHDEAVKFVKWIKTLEGIVLEGVWTHFSSADDKESAYTNEQIYIFRQIINELLRAGIDIPVKHAANSMAVIGFGDSHFNLVRPGLVLYGLYPVREQKFSNGVYPKQDLKANILFEPVMTLKTKIVFLKDVPAGRPVSYGRTFVTQKSSKIATLPIGYGDGYPRALSNKAFVLIRGQRAPVAGTICMDQVMIDVSHIKNVKVGDDVVLLGRQLNQQISAEELAQLAGTIPYEIVCSIAPRVPRVYRESL